VPDDDVDLQLALRRSLREAKHREIIVSDSEGESSEDDEDPEYLP
jgi:hypothetical protein